MLIRLPQIRAATEMSLLASALLVLSALPAAAQNPFAGLTNLTPAERSVGNAINSLCPNAVASNGGAPVINATPFPTTPFADLARRCTEMRQNATQLTGTPATASPSSLQLSSDGLAGVLQSATANNSPQQANSSINTRSAAYAGVANRLVSLRLGAGGVALNGLPLDEFSLATLGQDKGARDGRLADLVGPGTRGGGASADEPRRSPEGVLTTGGRLGVFGNVYGTFGDQNTTSQEVGFDFWAISAVVGADYRFTDNFVAGLALTYSYNHADLDFALGNTATNSVGLAAYGSYTAGKFWLDGYLGFAYSFYDLDRRIQYGGTTPSGQIIAIDRTARANTDGPQWVVNLGTGYDFNIGAFTLTPFARAEYIGVYIKSYRESGSAFGLALDVDSQTINSFQTVLGGQASYAINTAVGVFAPYVSAEWRHEFLNDSRSITARYVNDPLSTQFFIPTTNPDRDFAVLGVGVSVAFARGISAFLSYQAAVGLSNVSWNNFAGGVRVAF